MPEPTTEPLALEATALRYAARTLPRDESAAFETRLAGDQSAREALAEAVRLSAAALGQESPAPDRSFRSMIRERLHAVTPGWLARRAYRGHPAAWAGIGAVVVAAAALIAVRLADAPAQSNTVAASALVAPVTTAPTDPPSLPAPAKADELATDHPTTVDANDDMRKAAEIWAELSTPDHVEKTHDDEARLHNRFKHLRPSTGLDSREP